MRFFKSLDPGEARSMLRRLDRFAGAVNPFLIAIALGLVMLTTVCLAQIVALHLPPTPQIERP